MTESQRSCRSTKSRRQAVSQTLSVLSNPFATTTASVRTTPAPAAVEDGGQLQMVVVEEPQQDQKTRKTVKLCLRICSLLLVVVPIAMVVVGTVYFHRCPLESRLPLWLIVAGSVYIVGTIFDITEWIMEKATLANDPTEEPKVKCLNLLHFLLHISEFIWLIVGSVWVYTAFQDMYAATAPDSDYYCENVVFWMSFATVTLGNLIFAVLILFIFSIGLCAMYTK